MLPRLIELSPLILTQLWQVSVVIAVAGGLAVLATRRAPHLAQVLWLLVILKCLTPPLFSSPAGLLPPVPSSSTDWSENLIARFAPTFVADEAPARANAPAPFTIHPTPPVHLRQYWARQVQGWSLLLLGGAWLLGALALGAAILASWWRASRRIARHTVTSAPWLTARLDAVRERVGLRRRVRLVVSTEEWGPLVYGVWYPTVVLPASLVESRNPEQIESILAHELIHVRRGDTLLSGIQVCVQLIYWFHPLVWWANRQINRNSEQCCDEEVVAALDCGPRVYARCLLGVAEMRHRLRALPIVSGMRAAEITSRRLELLMQPNRTFQSRTPRYCWGILFVASMLLLPASRSIGFQLAYAADEPSKVQASADEAFGARDWETASRLYQRLVDKKDDDARSWFRLGYALHAAGRVERAIEAHRKAARFDKVKPVALYNLACALCLSKRDAEALATLKLAVDAGFTSHESIAKDPDLARIADRAQFKELAEQAAPPAAREVYRQFDFWIGTWDVFDMKGKKVGTNVITKDERGFLLTEKWTNSNGGTGTSINYYDPSAKQWKQTWVDAGGHIIKYAGEFKDGKMELSGDSILPNGRKELSRVTFTPQADGRVRQFIQRSRDDGASWSTYFDGMYIKQVKAGPGKAAGDGESPSNDV